MRTKYKIGSIYKIIEGAGIDSGKIVKIIPWFDWRKATDGTYCFKEPRNYVAIQYPNGDIGFFSKRYLIPMTQEKIFDECL